MLSSNPSPSPIHLTPGIGWLPYAYISPDTPCLYCVCICVRAMYYANGVFEATVWPTNTRTYVMCVHVFVVVLYARVYGIRIAYANRSVSTKTSCSARGYISLYSSLISTIVKNSSPYRFPCDAARAHLRMCLGVRTRAVENKTTIFLYLFFYSEPAETLLYASYHCYRFVSLETVQYNNA
jgi:hypothetical protein